jgi:hypothetical protein
MAIACLAAGGRFFINRERSFQKIVRVLEKLLLVGSNNEQIRIDMG